MNEAGEVGVRANLTAQGHLEDVSITSSTEQEVLAGVEGHRHDADVKQD